MDLKPGEVYIHLHQKNFKNAGVMALKYFKTQKEKAYKIAKGRYKKNYLENISINSLNFARFNDAMSEDEIISNLDTSLTEFLNENVSKEINSFNLETYLKKSYQGLDKFLKNPQDLNKLDAVFNDIGKAAGILTTDAQILAKIFRDCKGITGIGKLNKISSLLEQEIQRMNGKSLHINQKRYLSVLNSLKSFTDDIAKGELNKRTLQKYLSNIFSTQIGEYIVSKGTAKALELGIGEIRKSLKGTDQVKYTEDPEINRFIQSYGNQKNTFKPDTAFNNLNITLDEGETNININLGLSVKWYKNSGGKDSSVALASEKSFLYRIQQMFKSPTEQYYAYNAIGLYGQRNDLYHALKAAILARNIDTLISGLGVQGDFSQFIVINGEFYSIWNIILLLENYNTGDSADPKNIVTATASGISKIQSLHEKGLEEAIDRPSKVEAWQRTKEQINIINGLGFECKLHTARLKNALKNK